MIKPYRKLIPWVIVAAIEGFGLYVLFSGQYTPPRFEPVYQGDAPR